MAEAGWCVFAPTGRHLDRDGRRRPIAGPAHLRHPVDPPGRRVGGGGVSTGWGRTRLATVRLLPYWALVAWTIWQKPGGASLRRRVVISIVMVVGALLLVPLIFVIPWTRRWYWFWRTA